MLESGWSSCMGHEELGVCNRPWKILFLDNMMMNRSELDRFLIYYSTEQKFL